MSRSLRSRKDDEKLVCSGSVPNEGPALARHGLGYLEGEGQRLHRDSLWTASTAIHVATRKLRRKERWPILRAGP